MTRPRIIIETVTPEEMRPPYNEPGPMCGDWYSASDGVLMIKVTADVLSREGFLYALHELIEAMLCMQHGVPQEAVDAFDAKFTGTGEPGDDPRSPYRDQHRFSMLIEHLVARELGLDGYGEVT